MSTTENDKPKMTKVEVGGVAGFDGTYEIDLSTLTGRELHFIKRLSGVRAGELVDGLLATDYDLVIAIACVALTRDGHPHAEDAEVAFMDAEGGAVSIILPSPERPADPPPERP